WPTRPPPSAPARSPSAASTSTVSRDDWAADPDGPADLLPPQLGSARLATATDRTPQLDRLASGLAESAPGPDPLTDDDRAPQFVELDRDQGKLPAALVGPQDDMAAVDVEPANHRRLIGTRRHDLPMELDRIGHGAVDGHDRALGQDWIHGIVD